MYWNYREENILGPQAVSFVERLFVHYWRFLCPVIMQTVLHNVLEWSKDLTACHVTGYHM